MEDTMLFFSEREYGHEVFIQCFDALDNIDPKQRFRKVAKWLDLSEHTLRKYYRGDLSPPRAVVYALWHESKIGQRYMRGTFGQQDHWKDGYIRSLEAKQKRLESEVTRLQNMLGTLGAANDGFKESYRI
jgi:hypothetical protein